MGGGTGRGFLAAAGAVGKDLGTAVAAKEQGTLGEHRKTIDRGRTIPAHGDICHHTVIESDGQGIEPIVIRHTFRPNVSMDQLHTSGPGIGTAIQNTLTVTG